MAKQLSAAEDIYLFRHAAMRDVAYSLLPPSERASLHADALASLEQEWAGNTEVVAVELAEHARLAREGAARGALDQLVDAEARYLNEALRRHRRRGQWEQVVQCVERVFALPGRPLARRVELLADKVNALDHLGRREDVRRAAIELQGMAAEAGNVEAEVEGYTAEALQCAHVGQVDRASELLTRAQQVADARGTPAMRAMARMKWALMWTTQGEYARQEKALQEGLDLLKGLGASLEASLRGNLANLYGNSGRGRDAIALLEELLPAFRAREDWPHVAITYANLGRQRLLLAELDAAAECLKSGIEMATRVGLSRTVAFCLANLAEVQMKQGQLDSATASIEQAIELSREQGLPLYHAAYSCTLAELHLLLGHEAAAQELVEDARAQFQAVSGDAFVHEYCGVARVRIACSQAVSMAVPGRATSRLKATPPSPSWLPVARELSAGIQAALKAKGAHAGALLHRAAAEAANLVCELESAVKEKRPALIFRGHLPGEMLPALKRKLWDTLRPEEAEMLSRMHPALARALSS